VCIPKIENCKLDCLCLYLQKFDCRKKSDSAKLFSSLKWNPKQKVYEPEFCKMLSYNVALTNFKSMLQLAGYNPKNYRVYILRELVQQQMRFLKIFLSTLLIKEAAGKAKTRSLTI
jgi:hypothetical protein